MRSSRTYAGSSDRPYWRATSASVVTNSPWNALASCVIFSPRRRCLHAGFELACEGEECFHSTNDFILFIKSICDFKCVLEMNAK